MNNKDYQQEAMRTNNQTLKDHMLINAALGLAGESGEVVDIIKKHEFQGHKLDELQVKLELGDVLWYVALMAEALETTIDELMDLNINKLRNRYSKGFSKKESRDRKI